MASNDLLTVLLKARCAQAGEAMAVDRTLPSQELFGCERIAAAGFVQREQPGANRRNHLGLAVDHSTLRPGSWQISDRQRSPVQSKKVLGLGTVGLHHWRTHKHDDGRDYAGAA